MTVPMFLTMRREGITSVEFGDKAIGSGISARYLLFLTGIILFDIMNENYMIKYI